MVGQLIADVDEVYEIAWFAEGVVDVLSGGIESASGDVSQLLVGWHGNAATAYGSAWSELREGAQKLVATLEAIAATVHNSAARYEERDRASASSIQGVV